VPAIGGATVNDQAILGRENLEPKLIVVLKNSHAAVAFFEPCQKHEF
jgi:hypothetical protein